MLIPAYNLLDFTAKFTCDNSLEIFADGRSLGEDKHWPVASSYLIPGDTRVISVLGKDFGSQYGILGSFSNGLVTNESWKCSSTLYPGWNSPDFDDGHWPHAVVVGKHGDKPWGVIPGIELTAKWIWAAGNPDDVYCRLDFK